MAPVFVSPIQLSKPVFSPKISQTSERLFLILYAAALLGFAVLLSPDFLAVLP